MIFNVSVQLEPSPREATSHVVQPQRAGLPSSIPMSREDLENTAHVPTGSTSTLFEFTTATTAFSTRVLADLEASQQLAWIFGQHLNRGDHLAAQGRTTHAAAPATLSPNTSMVPYNSASSTLDRSTNGTADSPAGGRYLPLPMCLACPSADSAHLTEFQAFLRCHIEAFAASDNDVLSRCRGRAKSIRLYQVGIRCRHCTHIPLTYRAGGSTFFPSSTLGFYQAAQNLCSMHLQCGRCPEMDESVKDQFKFLLGTKTAGTKSSGGRNYWSHHALRMGLINTDNGVFPRELFPL